jgi:triosephosphate isomerase
MADNRRPLFAGNWKMNLTLDEAVALADGLKNRIGRLRMVDLAITPSFPYVATIAKRLAGERIAVGAQDIHPGDFGAFTGSVSGVQLRSAGASFVLVGHSERRHVFGDTDAVVAEKLQSALAHTLDAVLCIGETLDERDGGDTFAVCERQLAEALARVNETELSRITLAYEPVWAIGTGRTATPAQAQEVHRIVREWIEHRYSAGAAGRLRILYGGSVKPDNVEDLMAGPDVDGALVGGASLDAEKFSRIATYGSQGSA